MYQQPSITTPEPETEETDCEYCLFNIPNTLDDLSWEVIRNLDSTLQFPVPWNIRVTYF